ncbi:hypothetical protein [Silvibacterium dinghuense]|uniref:Uncharacterized protein n=1 Tax=Silvibacterium dinghuense TaxID=1560006 RepID=A0A4Q1SE59_9BACT|nr:hypothetical protein [Silvibacterium dinghuense]RXS95549.1 hypothetical protein ESZ00_13350 [Silvibacterium dinghuense]GGH13931.1 hypothetical protein GCM10011586_34120 [Silvibacterium dinghuense]
MAGVGTGSYGIFSALARQQYAAVAAIRLQMLRHGLRTKRGNFELGAQIFSSVFFGGIALLIGIGLGFGAYSIVSSRHFVLLPALFWPVFALWQFLPLMVASFQEHMDFGALRRFPLSFGSWMLLTLTYGALDIATIMGVICLYGIWVGLVVARPSAIFGVTLALVFFALFNFLLTRMIFAWIDRWLAQRKTREILGAVFLFLILGLQLVGPAIRHFSDDGNGRTKAASHFSAPMLEQVQALLPPGMTAMAVESALRSRSAQAMQAGGIALYAALAGLVLGVRLRAEYRGESLGESPGRTTGKARSKAAVRGGWLDGAGPIGAIVEKELHYLMRSGVLLYGLAAPPILMMVFGSGGRHGHGSIPGFAHFALPIAAAYSFLGLTRLIANSLGGDGGGVQLYFLAPVRFRTILLAKNLVHLGLFFVELILVTAVVVFRFGLPKPEMIELTACWLLFALPTQLAAGNLLSLFMAYRMTLTRMSREQGAAGNGLLSMAIQLAILGVGAAVYALLAVHGHVAAAMLALLAIAAIGWAFWFQVAKKVDGIALHRREALISQLVR